MINHWFITPTFFERALSWDYGSRHTATVSIVIDVTALMNIIILARQWPVSLCLPGIVPASYSRAANQTLAMSISISARATHE